MLAFSFYRGLDSHPHPSLVHPFSLSLKIRSFLVLGTELRTSLPTEGHRALWSTAQFPAQPTSCLPYPKADLMEQIFQVSHTHLRSLTS